MHTTETFLIGGCLVGINNVVAPADQNPLLGSEVGDRSIVVIPGIHKLDTLKAAVTDKPAAVKAADKVLYPCAAVFLTRTHADQQHPFFLAVNRQREQVGTFPYAAREVAFRPELTGLFPFLQVLGCVKADAVTGCQYHTPAAFRILEDLRVAEVGALARNDRVAFIFMEGDTIGRPCNRLLFNRFLRVAADVQVMGEHRNQRRILCRSESGRVLLVNDR